MMRRVIGKWNRTYNHGRKVGLGGWILDCGHRVGAAGRSSHPQKCWCWKCSPAPPAPER